MSFLNRIITAIQTNIYPRVKATVDAVIAKVENVEEHVADKVDEVIDKIEAARAEVAEVILDSPIAKRRTRETLAAERIRHKTETGEDLDYENSIVDLLKLIGEDSSMQARRQLATEFGMGNYKGTAEQNTWLAGKVMESLE